MSEAGFLKETEIDFNADLDCNGMAVFACRLETPVVPLPDRIFASMIRS
jgi:hypothetical protein